MGRTRALEMHSNDGEATRPAPISKRVKLSNREIEEAAMNEHDDEPARRATQQKRVPSRMPARVEKVKPKGRTRKKDRYVTEFVERVRKDEELLLGLIQDKREERERRKRAFEAKMKGLFEEIGLMGKNVVEPAEDDGRRSTQKKGHSSEAPFPSPSYHPGRAPAQAHPYFSCAETLINQSQTLIASYGTLAAQIEATGVRLGAEVTERAKMWEEERGEMGRILQLGKEAAEERVGKLLAGKAMKESGSGSEVVDGGLEKERNDVLKVFGLEEDEKERGRAGWAKVAKGVERGIRRVLRGLPATRVEED
ncbi:MAG: hypothetical protein M1819_007416 [Sarea resinae]|nr:MAG: hypothetical protein M1819_007416 [Sarea resinae]